MCCGAQTAELKAKVNWRHDCIIWPTTRGKATWDMFIIALVLYNAIFLPVDVAFSIVGPVWGAIDWVIDGLFIVDIFINFRTARFDEHGELVADARNIARL